MLAPKIYWRNPVSTPSMALLEQPDESLERIKRVDGIFDPMGC